MKVQIATDGHVVTTVETPPAGDAIVMAILEDGRIITLTAEGTVLVRDSKGSLYGYNLSLPGLYTANRRCAMQHEGVHEGEHGPFTVDATHVHGL